MGTKGAAWVACVIGKRFDRVLKGGTVTYSIPVDEDGRHAIACVLGGPDRRILYMLTATTFGNADEALATRDARIDVVEVDVPGAGWP